MLPVYPSLRERFMIRYVFAFLASLSLASVASSAGLSSKEELDAEVREAIEALYKHSSAAKELAGKASGMLVFPKVVKGGVVVGGEYGEGALLVGGGTVG